MSLIIPNIPKHDPFFSSSLEIPAIARAFFKCHLSMISNQLPEQVDLENIIRVDRKNTQPELTQLERDIIYKSTINKTGTIFLCCEHQSQAQRNMPLRLLNYYLDTVKMHLDAENIKWPLITSFLFYHGLKSPYPYSSELTDYYEDPILGSQQLSFRFYIIDITQVSDEEIITHGICAPVELLLKHGRDGKFELEVGDYRPVFYECINQVGENYILSMLAYAKDLVDVVAGKKIYEFIKQIFPDKQELIMTYGQQIEQIGEQRGLEIGLLKGMKEGMKEGMQAGIQTKAIEIAKSMLKKGAEINFIQDVTGTDKETIEEISKN
jgi:predicted transposase/invertase (TIGR01784 family)